MKKVVFLLSLFIGFNIQQTNASTTEIYRFDGYQIHLTYTKDDQSNIGYELEKIGTNPFSTMLIFDESDILISNVIEVEGNHVFYGAIHINNAPTFYEGFILELSPSGEEIRKEIIDYEMLEEVEYVFPMDSVIMTVICASTTDERNSYFFDHYRVLTYSYDFELIDEFEIYEDIKSFEATDYMLILNRDYDYFHDGGLTRDLELLEAYDLLSIETNEEFSGSVYIPFLNQALLNNNVVEDGIFLDYPGNYRLQYRGFTYQFRINPIITGVEENMIYTHSVTPEISSGNIFLNNDLFVSGSTITDPGYYQLQVDGLGGYETETDFTITSNMTGVIHNQTYQDEVEIVFNGNGYLNSNFVTSPHIVSEPGEYIFKIEGENDYVETYHFTIEEPIENHTFVDFIQQYDIAILGITLVSGLLFLKKK